MFWYSLSVYLLLIAGFVFAAVYIHPMCILGAGFFGAIAIVFVVARLVLPKNEFDNSRHEKL